MKNYNAHEASFPKRLNANIATPDHNVPTERGDSFRTENIQDEISKIQVVELDKNCNKFGIKQFDITSINQGIVHVIGPELGYTLPGMTIVCGDSHTSTHGAFGCLAMGIGTSEVEHVLATQTLKVSKLKNMNVRFNGSPQSGVTSKDIVLYLIRKIGTAGGNGHAIEFSGSYINSISMEARMTICNMSIEAGAGILALENSFNRVGLDHVILVKVASTAVISAMLGLNKEQTIDALSQAWVDGQSLRTYRHAPNAGPRKSWAAGDATSRALQLVLLTQKGQIGYPSVLTTPTWGFYDVQFKGEQFSLPREFTSGGYSIK